MPVVILSHWPALMDEEATKRQATREHRARRLSGAVADPGLPRDQAWATDRQTGGRLHTDLTVLRADSPIYWARPSGHGRTKRSSRASFGD